MMALGKQITMHEDEASRSENLLQSWAFSRALERMLAASLPIEYWESNFNMTDLQLRRSAGAARPGRWCAGAGLAALHARRELPLHEVLKAARCCFATFPSMPPSEPPAIHISI